MLMMSLFSFPKGLGPYSHYDNLLFLSIELLKWERVEDQRLFRVLHQKLHGRYAFIGPLLFHFREIHAADYIYIYTLCNQAVPEPNVLLSKTECVFYEKRSSSFRFICACGLFRCRRHMDCISMALGVHGMEFL